MKFKQIAVTSDSQGISTLFALDSTGDIWRLHGVDVYNIKHDGWNKLKGPKELNAFYDID